jgi:hypothetical protein
MSDLVDPATHLARPRSHLAQLREINLFGIARGIIPPSKIARVDPASDKLFQPVDHQGGVSPKVPRIQR